MTGDRRAAVITCSDSVDAGRAADVSGPVAAAALGTMGWAVHDGVRVVPDEAERVAEAVRAAVADGAGIVITTGGTGLGPRDVTVEAVRSLAPVEIPGLGEAVRAASRARVPTADLSRTTGFAFGGSIVLCLPGSPGGVRDGLRVVGPLLEHALAMLAGGGHAAERQPLASQPVAADGTAAALSTTGEPRAVVSGEPFVAADAARAVEGPRSGAVVVFEGRVRDHDGGRPVGSLRYEAHPDAGDVLARVVAAAEGRPGVHRAAAAHRVGELAVGDLAFVAAVSAAHRAEAFAACGWLVDEVKRALPVWKLQRFGDGSQEWVNSP